MNHSDDISKSCSRVTSEYFSGPLSRGRSDEFRYRHVLQLGRLLHTRFEVVV
jgi:hypothetical protein